MSVKLDPSTGLWEIDGKVTDPNTGKRHHFHKRGFKLRREAEAAYFKEMQLFKIRVDERMVSEENFSVLADGYVEDSKTRVRTHTVDNRLQVIRQWILPKFGNMRISDAVDPSTLHEWRQEIADLKFSPDRKSFIIRIMREIVLHGKRTGRIPAQVFGNAEKELEPYKNDSGYVKRVKRALTKPEYRAFMNTFDANDRYRILFQVFFYLGCRSGELMGLQWKDVDFKRSTVHIHQQIQYSKDGKRWHIQPTKTKAGDRFMKLSQKIRSELERLYEGFYEGPESFVFFGRHMSKNAIVFQLDRHCEMAGIGHLAPHEIRHTCASWLVASTRDMSDLIVVQRWLGHSSVKETLDTYSHYLKADDMCVSDALSDV